MHILLVEDEYRLSEALEQLFLKEKYKIDIVDNGIEAVDYILSDIYDCVVLDVMLPGKSGFDVLKEVRSKDNSTPILMLTAKSQTEDKVEGLDLGADDYLSKPYQAKELLARVRALLRRKAQFVSDNIKFGNIYFNKNTLKISNGTATLELSHLESELLFYLLSNKDRKLSKEDIIVRLWGYDSEAMDNNVEVYISMLRKKLKFIESNVQIKTTRNVGYQIEVV